MLACICHCQVSCSVSATALPRPYCCQVSTGCVRPRSSVPVSSTVAPGFGLSGALTLVTCGRSRQRAADAASLLRDLRGGVRLARARRLRPAAAPGRPAPTRVSARIDDERQRVGHRRAAVATFARTRARRRASADRRRADRRSRQSSAAGRRRTRPPRRCPESGRDTRTALRASSGSRRPARPDRQRRVAGTCCRPSAAATTTCRFLSSATARRMNFISNRGSPSK